MTSEEAPESTAPRGDADQSAVEGRSVRRRHALPALLLGSFMGVLDPFVVTVALPVIRADLGASFAQTQWMLAGYGTTYGVGLIIGGRLGDLYGRRRLFLAGMGVYAAASVAAGTAPFVGALIAARLVQGAAAAAMLPQVLAIIRADYAEPQRGRAIGWYGAIIGLGVVCGPPLGGLLVAADIAGWGWRSVFLMNLPLGLVVITAAALTVPGSRSTGPRRLDLLGAGLGAVTLLAFFVPVSQGAEAGWRWWVILPLAAVPLLLAVFVAHERRVERRGHAPVLPLGLFAARRFTTGILVVLLLYAAGAGAPLVFLFTYYLQDGLGRSPLWTGLVFAPLGVGFAVASVCAPRLFRRVGLAVPAIGAGIVVLGLGGLILVTLATPADLQPVLFLPVMLLAGFGQGLAANPVFAQVLAAAPESGVGPASGFLLTTTQVANIVGVIGVGAVFSALLSETGPSRAGYSTALSTSLVLLAAASLTTLALVVMGNRNPGS